MGVKQFDRKFGADFLRELPNGPAVYLFKAEDGSVLYAGKAKNIRRRLLGYRNAGRRKAHRKMRELVREASALEVRLQPSEREALLAENELIRTLRPPYNVDGTYTFLYPAIGLGVQGHQTLLGFTTLPERWNGLPLRWYGVFRSRARSREAFDALVALLEGVAHREPTVRLPEAPRLRGSLLVGLRRVPPEIVDSAHGFLAGASPDLLEELALRLLETRSACRDAPLVEEALHQLRAFYDADLATLRAALRVAGRGGSLVSRDERDALFISARHR